MIENLFLWRDTSQNTIASDITVSPPSVPGLLTVTSEFKAGVLVFYGTLIELSQNLSPYIQFKHVIPFGHETQFTGS